MKRKTEPTAYTIQSRERIAELIATYCDGSQQRFSERTGINKASVSQWMHGTNVPGSIAAGKIGRAFGVNPAWVMGFDVSRVAPVADAPISSTDLSDFEQRLIMAYRAADGITQGNVCKLLDVSPEKRESASSSLGNGAERTA